MPRGFGRANCAVFRGGICRRTATAARSPCWAKAALPARFNFQVRSGSSFWVCGVRRAPRIRSSDPAKRRVEAGSVPSPFCGSCARPPAKPASTFRSHLIGSGTLTPPMLSTAGPPFTWSRRPWGTPALQPRDATSMPGRRTAPAAFSRCDVEWNTCGAVESSSKPHRATRLTGCLRAQKGKPRARLLCLSAQNG
jgi:hypothetical protein